MALRGRSRAARPSPRVDRTRLPATTALDGWPPPGRPQGRPETEPGVQADSSAITALTRANVLVGGVVRPDGPPSLACRFPASSRVNAHWLCTEVRPLGSVHWGPSNGADPGRHAPSGERHSAAAVSQRSMAALDGSVVSGHRNICAARFRKN